VKILGWILTIIGSNGLTGTLVAKNSIWYSVDNLTAYIAEMVAEFIGTEQGFLNSLVWTLVDNLTDSLGEFLQADQEFVQTVDMLFYISIGVLALGVVLLAVGYIRGAMKKKQPQPLYQTAAPTASVRGNCANCGTPIHGQFCPNCGQKAGQI